MPKNFTANVGDVRFPYTNFQSPAVDTTAAQLIEVVGKQAKGAYEAYHDAKLEGHEVDPVAPVSVNGIELPKGQRLDDQSTIRLSQTDDELNLRKIKRMREQGIISASAAKMMASQAVQSASARLPGRAQEFRQQAAQFFGDFGEGVDLLDATKDEKNAADLKEFVVKRALTAGFGRIDQQSGQVSISDQEINKFMEITHSMTMMDQQNKQIETRFNQGKVEATYLDQYARNIAHMETSEAMGRIQAAIVNGGGTIMKPEIMANHIAMAKQRAYDNIVRQSLKKRPDGTAPLIDASQIQQIKSGIDSYFKTTEDLVKSQSFSEIMKTRREGVQSLLTITGANTFPMLAAAESAAPGASKYFVDLMPKLLNMSPEQRENLFRNDPQSKMFWDAGVAAQAQLRGMTNVLRGFLPDQANYGSEYNMTMLNAAAMGMDPEPGNENNKAAGINTLLQATKSGDLSTLYTLSRSEVKRNMTPEQKTSLLRTVASELAKLHANLAGSLVEYQGHKIKFDGQKYVIDADPASRPAGALDDIRKGIFGPSKSDPSKETPDIIPSISGQLHNATVAMNALLNVMVKYQDDPVFKTALGETTPEQYISSILKNSEEISAAEVKKKKEKPKAEPEVK